MVYRAIIFERRVRQEYPYPFPERKLFLCQVREVKLQEQYRIRTLAEFFSFPFH